MRRTAFRTYDTVPRSNPTEKYIPPLSAYFIFLFTAPLCRLQISNARHNAEEGSANDEGTRNQSGAAVGGGLNAIRNALRSRRYHIVRNSLTFVPLSWSTDDISLSKRTFRETYPLHDAWQHFSAVHHLVSTCVVRLSLPLSPFGYRRHDEALRGAIKMSRN